jgi:hypothetical protein
MFNKIMYNYNKTPSIFDEKLILRYIFTVGVSLISLGNDNNNHSIVNLYFDNLQSYITSPSKKLNTYNEITSDLNSIIDLYRSTSHINTIQRGIDLFTIPNDKYLPYIININNITFIEDYYSIKHISKKETYSNIFLLYIAKILLLSIKKYNNIQLLQLCTTTINFMKSLNKSYVNNTPSIQTDFNKFLNDNKNIFINNIIDYNLYHTKDIFKNLVNILYKHTISFNNEWRNQLMNPSISLVINRYKCTINLCKGILESFINCINSNNIENLKGKTNYDIEDENVPYLKKYLKYKEKYLKIKNQ